MSLLALSLLTLIWLVAVYFFRHYRIWLPYYVVGSVGLAFLLIAISRDVLPIELFLKAYTGYSVDFFAHWVGVETRTFVDAPGVILVLVIPQEEGWTLVEIGVGCSGLLEEAVLVGLLGFYPSWSLRRRVSLISVGIALTFIGNLARVLFIVMTLHQLGKSSLFLAHSLFGRVLFFVVVIAIYWVVLTAPTMQQIRARLEARQSA
jgi:exosortase family protein XrtG